VTRALAWLAVLGISLLFWVCIAAAVLFLIREVLP
jgi:hypothetical protein